MASEPVHSLVLTWLGDHSVLQPLLLAAVVCFLVLQALSVYKAKTSALSKIPGPWYAPLTSVHLRYLFAKGTVWKYVQAQHQRYGPVIRLGPRQIWVADKDALKDILRTTDLPKVTMYAEISRERTSPGLFGEIRPIPHKNLKRFLGPAFTVTAVDDLDSFFMDCVAILLRNYYKQSKQLASGTGFVTDMMRDLHCLALDIMGESNFGKGFGQIDQIFNPELIKTVETGNGQKSLMQSSKARHKDTLVYVKRTLRKIGITVRFDWPAHMTRAISTLIDDRRLESSTETKSRRRDILQHMLDEGNRPDTGVRMNNQDIIDQMSELLLAGSETTSGTIGCIFLEIAKNPSVKAKLLASLPPLGQHDPILDSKTVREGATYRYLEACIKEGLRMHPIASEMGRRTLDQQYQIGEYDIPPYTVVSASYRQLHHEEYHWPQAERFWPERWLSDTEREDAPEPDWDAYYPFSAGKHACIGQNFAYAEIRTITANVFSRFDVEEVDMDKEIDFRQFITMQFHDGSWRAKLTARG